VFTSAVRARTRLARALAALAVPLWTTAQDNQFNNRHQKYAGEAGLAPYTGAERLSPKILPRAVDKGVNNRHRDVRYTVTNIGVVPGQQSSFLPIAGSINNSGDLAGYAYRGPIGASIYLTAVGFT
jgi:hypothetical protein